jgi:alkaline phosphatase
MAHDSSLTRRGLFRLVAGAGGAFGVLSGKAPVAAQSARPRNVIFMVVDGMSVGVPSLLEPFSRLVRGRGTHWAALARDAQTARGWSDTASLGSLVTDSSAASSAWATGSRVMNGSVNVLPDGRRLTPIGVLARQSGRRVGLVTTTTVTHATPACFAAIHPSRDQEENIATQYLDVVDVLLGGGSRHFDGALRADRKDLRAAFAAGGYQVIGSRAELLAASRTGRMLGLFGAGHLPYEIDRSPGSAPDEAPTLSEMTAAALAALDGSPGGFLLQVEGGRIDHAAHANDAAGALREMLAFDDALGVVMEYARRSPDTLVIVTSDHGNSNPGLNGMGDDYEGSTKGFELLAEFRGSAGLLLQQLRDGRDSQKRVSAAFVSDVVQARCGIILTADDARTLAAAAGDPLPLEINKQHANASGILAQVVGNYTGIGWTGMSHTADVTMMMATGPGRERFASLQLNSDAFSALTALWEIAFVNPAM